MTVVIVIIIVVDGDFCCCCCCHLVFIHMLFSHGIKCFQFHRSFRTSQYADQRQTSTAIITTTRTLTIPCAKAMTIFDLFFFCCGHHFFWCAREVHRREENLSEYSRNNNNHAKWNVRFVDTLAFLRCLDSLISFFLFFCLVFFVFCFLCVRIFINRRKFSD